MAGHVTPEATKGGPIAVVQNGDTITFDVPNRRLDLMIPTDEIEARLQQWTAPPPKYTSGVLAKYARAVSSRQKVPSPDRNACT